MVDASAWVTALVDDGEVGSAARRELTAGRVWVVPSHAPLEAVRTILHMLRSGTIAESTATELAGSVVSAPVRQVSPDARQLAEVWSLRDAVSPDDAPYVVIARSYGIPLVTVDRRLARAARTLGVDVVVPGEEP